MKSSLCLDTVNSIYFINLENKKEESKVEMTNTNTNALLEHIPK